MSVSSYADIIRKKYLQRKIIEIADNIKIASTKSYDNASSMLIRYQRYFNELLELQIEDEDSLLQIAKKASEVITKSENIIRFGINYLDNFAGGMSRSELTSLGGRPGNGKTTLTLNIARSLAAQGLDVMIFNRDMTNTAMIGKLVVMESEWLTYSMLREQNLDNKVIDEINRLYPIVAEKYKTLKIYDNIRDMDTTLWKIKKYRPDVFIDDFIQRIRVNAYKRTEHRRFEIESIMDNYGWIAKEINASGFLVSQLSRDIEKRVNAVPVLADFAEGSTIEQYSENCLFVYYPYYFNPIDNPPDKSQLIIKKARYGTIGTHDIGFNGNKCLFYELHPQF